MQAADMGRPRRFCSDRCRKKFSKRKKDLNHHAEQLAKIEKRKPGRPKDQPHIERAREIIEQKADDLINEIMEEEIRAGVTQLIKDKLLGAAAFVAETMPEAWARIYEDMQSEDWAVRSRAYNLYIKWGMPMMTADVNTQGSDVNITIKHGIPTPDTQFGETVDAHFEEVREAKPRNTHDPSQPYDPVTNPEEWEKDYPLCHMCQKRVHPDNTVQHTEGGAIYCRPCHYQTSFKRRDNAEAVDHVVDK